MSKPLTNEYPYLPEGREILYVSLDNPFMQAAKKMADQHSGCSWWQTGAVVVKDGQIIGQGANSGNFQPVCPRLEHNCKSGEGYEFCEDPCKQDGHSEITSTKDAIAKGNDTDGADVYLYGHWWCCKPCWDQMIKCGIRNVHLLENAHQIFTRGKRKKVMEEIAKRKSAGEKITLQDVIWTLDQD